MFLASAIGGSAAAFLRLPVITGYLLGGSVVGPGGIGLIVEFVQVETLAQFGSIVILFSLGVDFHYDKLRQVVKPAVVLMIFQAIAMCITAAVVAKISGFAVRFTGIVYVGFLLSMASTTIAWDYIRASAISQSVAGHAIQGNLIIQDVVVGAVLMAENMGLVIESRGYIWGTVLMTVKLVLLIGITFALTQITDKVFVWLIGRRNDLFILVILSFCIAMTLLTQALFGTFEVGAFMAGIIISSSTGHSGASLQAQQKSLQLVEPLRDVFGVLFFSSIGMLINPHFLLEHAFEIAILCLMVFIFKYLSALLGLVVSGFTIRAAMIPTLCIAQVGEFAFILAQRAFNKGIVSERHYVILLATTAVHLLTAPLVMRIGAEAQEIREALQSPRMKPSKSEMHIEELPLKSSVL